MLLDIVATSGRQYWRTGNIKKKKAETAQISNSQMWSWKPHQNHRKVNQESAAQLSSAGHLHCVSTVQSLRICAPSHGHSAGFTFTQSVVFILIPISVHLFYFREEAGHWFSSRAQTCCGHPVRPFTFFSVPKDSCRPSVCDTKNTPNYHHQQQQQRRQEATNKPQSVWTFSAYYYYISCYSAGQTRTKQWNVVNHVILVKEAIPQSQNHLTCKIWHQKRFWRTAPTHNTAAGLLPLIQLLCLFGNIPFSALFYKHFIKASFSFIYNII